eukprot:6892-Heterococcus_DN1.PRE.5
MRQLERQLAERALCDPGVQVRVTRHIVRQVLEHNTSSSSSVVHEANAVSLKHTLCCGDVPYTLPSAAASMISKCYTALASAMEIDLANGVLGSREAAQKLVQRFVNNISSSSSSDSSSGAPS